MVSEAHVHHLGRMSVSSRQVNQTPFGKQVEPPPAWQSVLDDLGAHLLVSDCNSLKIPDLHLYVIVADITQDSFVFHLEHV